MKSLLSRLFKKEAPEEISEKARIGAAGEKAAERFLVREKKFKVLARNWRNKQHELDLVCDDKGVLVFVETRTRKTGTLVSGYHSVTTKKKKALLQGCRAYMAKLKHKPLTQRLDIVEVEHEDGVIGEIRHFEDVPLFSKPYNR